MSRIFSVVLLTSLLAVSPALAVPGGHPPGVPTTRTAEQTALLHQDYAPAFEAAAKAIDGYKVASGVKMSVFAAEPQLANPVALYIDEKNRFWVVETFRFDGGGDGWGVYDIRHIYDKIDDDLASKTVEQRLATMKKWNNGDLAQLEQWPDRLRLIEDRDGNGKADHSSVFAEWSKALDGIASGVITKPGTDDVYVTNIPHLLHLRDKDGDGKADIDESLSFGYGVRYSLLGHDLHGLRWGPDGRLYFSNGDRGMHVETKEGKVLDYPDEGTVMRCEPDGSNLEVFARGLRNPQKLVFDQYGNLFTGDNNCDNGDQARWVYVVEGGDTGWRIGYQHIRTPGPTGPWLAENLWKPLPDNTAAYINPPIANIASGPSGCTVYPGVGLPEKYNGHFFLTDFRAGPSSAIHSFALKPKGAGWELVDRDKFVERVVATDIEFGPDCAAYITDWNASWSKTAKGRIYRVAAPDLEKSPLVLETKKLLMEGMKNRKSDELRTLLGHADMRVRQLAQFELAARGVAEQDALVEVALKSDKQMARIHAMWTLGQISRTIKSTDKLAALIPVLDDKDDEIRAQAIKVLGEARVEAAMSGIVKAIDDKNARVQYFAALNAGRYRATPAVPALLALLMKNENKDVYLRHAASMGLSLIDDPSTLIAAAKNDSPAARLGVLLAMRRLKMAEVRQFLDDKDALVVTEAARAINDVPIEAAQADLARKLGSVTLPEPVIHRALHANFRIGGAENATAVAKLAARGDAPPGMRIEALQMLAKWAKPRGIDRVTGNWRPLPPRDSSITENAAKPVLTPIVSSAPDNVRLAAIDLVKKIGIDDPNVLFDLVAGKEVNPDVAAAALSAMDERKDPRLGDAVEVALTNGKGALRTGAIHLLARKPDAATRLSALLTTSSIPDQQAVLTALGTIENETATQILSAWMDKLVANTVTPELVLDLLESAQKSKSDALKEKVKRYEDARKSADVMVTYRECLVGGDVAAGKKVFFERQDVSCMRCHKIANEGGVAGPDLSTIASRRDVNYLLQSIVDPNVQIAPGFESVTVKVKAGKNYAGVVKSDIESEIVLDAGDGAIVHISKKEVESRTKGLSPMPQEISKTLSKRDVRDLVAYMATLKEPTTKPATTKTSEKTIAAP